VTSEVRAGAYAIVRQQEPQILLAEDASVLDRALALHIVAQLSSSQVTSEARLHEMRAALLEERWADALAAWIEETGVPVDVYDEAPAVWTGARLDADQASLEIRFAPLFQEV
jgi:hypothetical protein